MYVSTCTLLAGVLIASSNAASALAFSLQCAGALTSTVAGDNDSDPADEGCDGRDEGWDEGCDESPSDPAWAWVLSGLGGEKSGARLGLLAPLDDAATGAAGCSLGVAPGT